MMNSNNRCERLIIFSKVYNRDESIFLKIIKVDNVFVGKMLNSLIFQEIPTRTIRKSYPSKTVPSQKR